MLSFHFTSGYRLFCWPWWKHWLTPRTYYQPFIIAYQRATRGFADCDTWSLDGYVANVMPKALQHLKDNTHGYPSGLSEKRWAAILDIMIDGFNAANKLDGSVPDEFVYDRHPVLIARDRKAEESTGHLRWINETIVDHPEFEKWNKEQHRIFNKGMKYFTKYFFNLWD